MVYNWNLGEVFRDIRGNGDREGKENDGENEISFFGWIGRYILMLLLAPSTNNINR